MDKIDNLDKKILSILSKNARIPFKDVAAECGVSRAAIHQRVQHLINGGVITGSGFDVNPKSIGYSTCTYVGLNLERGSMYKDVVKQLFVHNAAQSVRPRQRTAHGSAQQQDADDTRSCVYRDPHLARPEHQARDTGTS